MSWRGFLHWLCLCEKARLGYTCHGTPEDNWYECDGRMPDGAK